MTKDMLKKIIDYLNKEKFRNGIEEEAQDKPNERQWKENMRTEIGTNLSTWKN